MSLPPPKTTPTYTLCPYTTLFRSQAVTGLHHFYIVTVEQLHLGLQLAVGEGHLLAADVGDLFAQIFGADPVEGQVGERGLRAPARRHVEVVEDRKSTRLNSSH